MANKPDAVLPLEFVPAIRNSAEIRSLAETMTHLCQAGNPDALYREGITSFFENKRTEREDEGLAQLIVDVDRGHLEARYIYDMILICSSFERRIEEGYNILATLMQPRLRASVIRMVHLRDELTQKYLVKLQGGVRKAADIIGKYYNSWSNCLCDKSDIWEYLYRLEVWAHTISGREAVEFDPPNNTIYQKYLWECEVIYFLDWLLVDS